MEIVCSLPAMKTLRTARTIMDDVSATRDDITRALDGVERATKTGMLVFLLVGIVASLALVIAVSKET